MGGSSEPVDLLLLPARLVVLRSCSLKLLFWDMLAIQLTLKCPAYTVDPSVCCPLSCMAGGKYMPLSTSASLLMLLAPQGYQVMPLRETILIRCLVCTYSPVDQLIPTRQCWF